MVGTTKGNPSLYLDRCILMTRVLMIIFSLIINSSTTLNAQCSGIVYDSRGSSGKYSSSEDVTYTYSAPAGNVMQLTINSFYLETNYDFLYIYDGASTSAPLMYTLTGNNPPTVITSTGQEITLRFISDSTTEHDGWEITLSCYSNTNCQSVPNQGLIAYYNFKELSGDVVHDVSGYLTPLNLVVADPRNVSWNSGCGISINSETEKLSVASASKIVSELKKSNALTIEAWVKPANTTQSEPAQIVTISDGAYDRNITLGQENDEYAGRLRTSSSSITDNGQPGKIYKSKFTTIGGHNNIQSVKIPLPPRIEVTDINVVLPISELTYDYRLLNFNLTAGTASEYVSRTWDPSGVGFPDECCIDTVNITLNDVPADAEYLEVEVDSPGSSGQSYVIARLVYAEIECYEPEICADNIDNDNDGLIDCEDIDCGFIQNREFDNELANWDLYQQGGSSAAMSIDEFWQLSGRNSSFIDISQIGASATNWHIQFVQDNLSFEDQKAYEIIFDAKATANRTTVAALQINQSPRTGYFWQKVHLGAMSMKVSNAEVTDFTSSDFPVFDYGTSLGNDNGYTGLAQRGTLISGYNVIWAGDFDSNGKVKFTNPFDDQNVMFINVIFNSPEYLINYDSAFGYLTGDYNMDGKVKYTNPSDDLIICLVNCSYTQTTLPSYQTLTL